MRGRSVLRLPGKFMEKESISYVAHPYLQMSFPQSSVSPLCVLCPLVVKAIPRDHSYMLGLQISISSSD